MKTNKQGLSKSNQGENNLPQDFSAKMEGITESRLLSLFGCQCFDRLQIEVVIQMEIVEIFPVNQQIQHVIA